jgi:hypothetical protein
MSARPAPWPAFVGGVILLAACTNPPTSTTTGNTLRTDADDYVLLLDDDSDPDQIQGEAGIYALTARGTAAPLAVLDVPPGYSNFGHSAVWPQADEDDPSDDTFSTVEYWTVDGVYEDPCRWEGAAPEIGATVDDLVEAVSEQRHTAVTAGPEPVTLDGYSGVRLTVRVPADLDTSRCTEGRYMFWNGSPGDAHHQAPLGTTEEWWFLDVDRQRVVLGTAATEGVSESDVEDLTAMVESVRFVEPE